VVNSTAPKAALDIGSNTIRLLVTRFSNGDLVPIEDASEFVRLGKGVHASGELQEDRMVSAIEAIGELIAKAKALGADEVITVATSAVRDASNRTAFVRRVHDETGVRVRILSGEEEARLTYLGATLGIPIEGGAVVCDLGGGSAEVIFATSSGIEWATSLQLGSGRLTEQFVHHDPPQPGELEQVRQYTQGLLRDLPPAEAAATVLTGGTATHIAVLLGKSGDVVQLGLEDLEHVLAVVSSQSADRIVEEYEVRRERAEVLPAGVAAAAAIVDFYETEHTTITRRGIREGAIVDSVRPAPS
jgi:exopolyphosphatase / guanosine-5'-triphosphate,3'-diphosphate pyrophosphatase